MFMKIAHSGSWFRLCYNRLDVRPGEVDLSFSSDGNAVVAFFLGLEGVSSLLPSLRSSPCHGPARDRCEVM